MEVDQESDLSESSDLSRSSDLESSKDNLNVMMKAKVMMSKTMMKILFKGFFLSFEIICNNVIVTLKPLINMYLFYPNSYINFAIITLRILTRIFI